MVYAIVGLAVACFGMIVWMALWVSSLKNAIAEAVARAELWEKKHAELEITARQLGSGNTTLRAQLEGLRKAHEEVLHDLQAGSLDTGAIAALLRRGLS